MRGRKNVIWQNSTGQEVVFNNIDLFVESIDMTGTVGIHTVESLAGADGQVTLSHNLGAKTIPCSFALKDKTGTRLESLAQMFCPGDGLLTVTTSGGNMYKIDCYPQNIPVFKRSEVPYVWRFDVDFVADKPLWRKGVEIEKTYSSLQIIDGWHVLISDCVFDIAPKLYFPASSSSVTFQNNPVGYGRNQFLTVRPHPDFAVIVDTENLTVKNASNGANVNYLIDASQELDEIRIRFGINRMSFVSGGKIIYQNLSAGEV